MDLIHHYIIEGAAPEHHTQLNRILTGDLDTFMPTPTPLPRPALPPPPPWSRIRTADIARMARAREQAEAR